MTYLLDTNVISETRKRSPNQHVLNWFAQAQENDLYLSVLTLGELTKGVAKLRETDADGADSLLHWLRGIEAMFSDRLIPIDAEIAGIWGALNAGRTLPVIDSLLAATALARDLTLVTRNVTDVEPTGVSFIDPWEPK